MMLNRTTMITSLLLATFAYTPALGKTIVVSPGNGEFQRALDHVEPGDTIELMDGIYYEAITTKRDGEKDDYITIHGQSYNAVLKGSREGSTHIFDLQHSYYHLDRFTIDGYLGDNKYADKCLYVQTSRESGEKAREINFNGHTFKSSINGIAIANMDIRNCGGECMRMRYFVTYAQVYNNLIENCGTHDFVTNIDGGKNGEGIYLGTSSNQWDDGKNPTGGPDESQYNHFFDNHFETHGNEGIDIKEGSSNNLVENNYCTAQRDPESACLDARGSGNIIRFNTIVDNTGAGVRLGGHNIDGYQYGEDNDVYGNYMDKNDYAGIKIMVVPQGLICDNKFEGGSETVRGSGLEGVLDATTPCQDVDSEDSGDDDPDSRNYTPRMPHLSAGDFKTGAH